MLIVLSWLPGTGQTRIARAFRQATSAVHVRIDSIEQAIRESGVTVVSLDDAGDRAGYAVAEDNLRPGHRVSANPVERELERNELAVVPRNPTFWLLWGATLLSLRSS